MHLLITLTNIHVIQNYWNKNSKWLLTKARYKMYKWNGTKNLITAKTVLQCRIEKTRKGNVNGYKAKANVQINTYKVHCDVGYDSYQKV